jgi:hypothetical protein
MTGREGGREGGREEIKEGHTCAASSLGIVDSAKRTVNSVLHEERALKGEEGRKGGRVGGREGRRVRR